MSPSPLRHAMIVVGAAVVSALSGCAALNSISTEVSTFGTWPAGRPPGSYAFERLPSQASRPQEQAALEDAARGALEKAGFTPAADLKAADVTVQVGSRLSRVERSPWDDPMWWRWGAGYGRYPGRYGWGAGMHYEAPRYEREVALLIRDRSNGTPLFEARAASEGGYSTGHEVTAAMFAAALTDFPTPALSPRTVTVQIP